MYELESSARSAQNQLVVTAVNRLSWFTHYATYIVGEIKSDSDGPSSFPANTYDLSSEYGYSAQDVRHTLYWGGWVSAYGLNFTPTLVWRSGLPFNITTGRDANGDSQYTERPAFAADPASPGAVVTPFGVFDLNPSSGQPTIPRNFGRGPSFTALDLSVSRTFQIGPSGGARSVLSPTLTLSIEARNILNHTNHSTPVGNLSSPHFGRSNALAGDYGFGTNFGGNRRVTVSLHLGF